MASLVLTSGAGFAAVAGKEHGIVTVQVGTILLDVFAVYFPKHFATPTLLLPWKKKTTKTEKQTR